MESSKDQIKQARINRDITNGSKKLLVPGNINITNDLKSRIAKG
jgi:hypothetical protein